MAGGISKRFGIIKLVFLYLHKKVGLLYLFMLYIENIRSYCNDDMIVLTEHLLSRMRQRNIRLNDVKKAIAEGEKAMKCGICKAEMEEKTVSYTEDIEQGVIVIRNVPALVCTECGNIWYNGVIAAQLEAMVDKYSALTGSEVSVINFARSVA